MDLEIPTVTILIANYNGALFLERAVRSALAQTVPANTYEVLVVDDGSTDESLPLLSGFDVRVLSLEHRGLPSACNAGLEQAKGTLVIRLDSDDELEPAALAEMTAELDQHPGAAYVSADRTEIDSATGASQMVRVNPANIYDLIAPGVMFRRELLIDLGLYNDVFWEEYDLFLRVLLAGHPTRHINQPLYRYYRHTQSMTASEEARQAGWKQLLDKWGSNQLRAFGTCVELEAACIAWSK